MPYYTKIRPFMAGVINLEVQYRSQTRPRQQKSLLYSTEEFAEKWQSHVRSGPHRAAR